MLIPYKFLIIILFLFLFLILYLIHNYRKTIEHYDNLNIYNNTENFRIKGILKGPNSKKNNLKHVHFNI